MESVSEIEDMNVSELRSFLRLHGVPFGQVTRLDGSVGTARKPDLRARALQIRYEYDYPEHVTVNQLQDTSYTTPPSSGTQNDIPNAAAVPAGASVPASAKGPRLGSGSGSGSGSQSQSGSGSRSGSGSGYGLTPAGNLSSSQQPDQSISSTSQAVTAAPRFSADNPFQRKSPSLTSTPYVEPQFPQDDNIKARATPSTSKNLAKLASKRRSSVGWVNPSFLARISGTTRVPDVSQPTLGMSESAQNDFKTQDATTRKPISQAKIRDDRDLRREEAEEEVTASRQNHASSGDELICTDKDEQLISDNSKETSDAFVSDDSVVLTDEDEKGIPDVFEFMTVVELREWLARHKVPFRSRSRKATLISQARAHQNYLQTIDADRHRRPSISMPMSSSTSVAQESSRQLYRGDASQTNRTHVGPASNALYEDPSRNYASLHSGRDTYSSPSQPSLGHTIDLDNDSDYDDGDDEGDDEDEGNHGNDSLEASDVAETYSALSVPKAGKKQATSSSRRTSSDRRRQLKMLNDVQMRPGIHAQARVEAQENAVKRHAEAEAKAQNKRNISSGRETRYRSSGQSIPSQPRTAVDVTRKHALGRRPASAVRAKLVNVLSHMPSLRFHCPRITLRSLFNISLFLLSFWILLSFYNIWRVSQRPFCPNGASKFVLSDGRECRPCPEHGICLDGHLECDMGFRKINGRCAEDQEVSLYAEHLASLASQILRARAGRAECGDKVSVYMSDRELRDELSPEPPMNVQLELGGGRTPRSSRRRDRYDPSKFGPAYLKTLDLLHSEKSFGVVYDEHGFHAAEPQLPLSCIVRRFVLRHWQMFGGLVLVILSWMYLISQHRRAVKRREAVKSTCDKALQILQSHWMEYREGAVDEPFVIDTQLRDEILGSSSKAVKLWKEAEEVLRRDTRVTKSGPRTVRGHPCYTWEWRGRTSAIGSNSGGRGSANSSGSRAAALRRHLGRHDSASDINPSPLAEIENAAKFEDIDAPESVLGDRSRHAAVTASPMFRRYM